MAEEEPSVKQLPDGSQVICEGGVCRLLPPPARQDASDTGEEEGKTNEEQGEDTVERTQGGNPAFVAQHISMEQADQLVDFGFPRLRAEKALFHIRQQPGGGGIEAAVEWLEVHAEDEDIDEPIKEEEKPKEKVVLTEEEAQRRAYELQKKLREDRIEREKKEAIEREKLRLAQTKAMLEQNAKLEEEQRKRQLAQLQKEKEDHKRERERQRQLLREEYRERFGCEMPEEDDATEEGAAARLKKMNGKEKVAYWCNRLMKKYRKDQKEQLRVCFTTVRVYCLNAKDHPLEEKYLKIRKENNAFKSRVLPFEGALELLDVCGFKDTGDFLAISGQPDGFVLGQALKFLDVLLEQLKN
ncbi:PUB domain-containing protein [Toxoplasma gondii MAS]|uniref:PUB domain-containing protein n=2 Tax=Toxoplasma gondii TaxID=5811 RepID=A0A086QPN4_TOXGO|nr:PUB domain-containing protein [Toxoplasma gondii MAS]PUA87522.1 PUB domain-containing protein [Toxoplasma gondii TgCATBr9]